MRKRSFFFVFQVAAVITFMIFILENFILGNYQKVFNETNVDEFVSHLKLSMKSIDELILNEEVFMPLGNDSIIIVVQVHKRITYLRHLIVSLAQARDISETLLIFSHDFYDEEINELVQSIDFCKVMQIFYPFSIQAHPNEFPGTDPKDCPRNISKTEAIQIKCQNVNFPDLYGHYREAAYTQTKHHWWWKANRVFDQLEVTRYHTGLVLFLEEDHYVAEDFLYLLNLMDKTTQKLCANCNVLSLGTYKATLNNKTFDKVTVAKWKSSEHNMGMAFNRTTWNEIKLCTNNFCNFDDYNWDWSLQYISKSCLNYNLNALVALGPRVYHIGVCGVHHREKDCNENEALKPVEDQIELASEFMFPKELKFKKKYDNKILTFKENGGWGDKRDHLLCRKMVTFNN